MNVPDVVAASPERRIAGKVALWFALAIFASAFLMFLLEPMIAKMFLPHLGGGPIVWNTCLVFFQLTLLAGYGFAHGADRLLGARGHAILFSVIVVAAALQLPFAVAEPPQADAGPSIKWLLTALTVAVGLPFFVLATTTSSLQKWFARTGHESAHDPYFLYAGSNAGSLAGLIAYPLVVEPRLTLTDQRAAWAIGFTAFGLLAVGCAAVVFARRAMAESALTNDGGPAQPVRAEVRAKWVALAFLPSALLVSVTTVLSTDIAPVPLLWIVPLALYLLTFVVAFSARARWLTGGAVRLAPALVAIFTVLAASGILLPLRFALPFHLILFTCLALVCHGYLALTRPHAQHLTEFYFWISLGGVLGGFFSALLSPVLFDSLLEYPLLIVLGGGLAAMASVHGSSNADSARFRALTDLVLPLVVGGTTVLLILGLRRFSIAAVWLLPPLCGLGVAAFSQRFRATAFTATTGALLLAASLVNRAIDHNVYAERTFFGMYRVVEDPVELSNRLLHGTTLHGAQPLDPRRQGEPSSYYTVEGPIGQAFAAIPELSAPIEIAVVGLGVGGLSAYARPGQTWTFYEIDPAIERIARDSRFFSYLERCGSRCKVVLGDARLSLRGASPNQYSMIVLDAFSSDAIPMHLMTREALSLYLSKLSPDGVLAVHISNRHLELGPIVARLAQEETLSAVEQAFTPRRDARLQGALGSRWVFLAKRPDRLSVLARDRRWKRPVLPEDAPLWTDDFSNILSALKY